MSTKLLFFLLTSTNILKCMSEKLVELRGSPEVDYPTYYVIPKTSFSCSDQLYNPGFYADIETRCQVFHYCYEHRQESFLCPMGTIFNQPILACDYWYSSNCSLAPSYYKANAVKRNGDDFDEPVDTKESQSGNLFDKMAGLYKTNETTESAVLKNGSGASENELLSKEDIGTSMDESIEKFNNADDYNKYSYDTQSNVIDEKHLEIVKYNVEGSNYGNIDKGYKNQHNENDDMEDFIFSEDGMLHRSQEVYQVHPNQEDIYKIQATDVNFDQEYSGYGEIPSEVNFNFVPNEELDYGISEFDLQKRYSDMNGNHVRRPSRRKPIIIPEVEPEIVQLPVTKHKRKPIVISSTVIPIVDSESIHETIPDPNIYNVNVRIPNENFEDAVSSGEFSLDDQNLNQNLKFSDPSLLYNIAEKNNDENSSEQHEFFNIPESKVSDDILGSGSNEFGISYTDQSALSDLNYENKLEIITENDEDTGMQEFPVESSDTIFDYGNWPGGDSFLGSGSEENIQPHSSDESSFPEGQYIFSDSEGAEISDYAQSINLSDTFEESSISAQETFDSSNFGKVNDPDQFISEYSEDSPEYLKDSFSPETLGKFLPSDSSENIEWGESVSLGSGESRDFSYLPYETSNDPQNGYEKTLREVQETDGAYYIFSDSEHQLNYMHGDSRETYPGEDYSVNENFGIAPDDLIDSVGSQYVPGYPNFKMHDVEKELDNPDSEDLNSASENAHDYQDINSASENAHDYQDINSASENAHEYREINSASENAHDYLNINSALENAYDYRDLGDLENGYFYQDSRLWEKTHERLIGDSEVKNLPHVSEEGYTVSDSETTTQFTTEDVTFLEIMSQTPIPMLKNLFEVSGKLSSDATEDEIFNTEVISSNQDIIDQNHQDLNSLKKGDLESLYPNQFSDAEVSDESMSEATEDEIPRTEIISSAQDVMDQNHIDPKSSEEVELESFFSYTSDADVSANSSSNPIEDEIPDAEFLSTEQDIIGQNHENPGSPDEVFDFESLLSFLSAEQKIEETVSRTDGSGEDGTEVFLPEENVEVFVPKKEADPFNPLFSEGKEILVSSKSKQQLTLKAPPMKLKNAEAIAAKSKDLNEATRGKRSETLRTFNPAKKGNQFNPSKKTSQETMFTNIPSEFLKMKRSSMLPYTYNNGLMNSGLKARVDDQLGSSKLSKLTNFGKRLLAAKSKNFNIMKRYLNSYRNY